MWQSLQVTDIQHNYVSFCAEEKERCVNLEATVGHDCIWVCVPAVCVTDEHAGHKPAGRNKTNESSLTVFKPFFNLGQTIESK